MDWMGLPSAERKTCGGIAGVRGKFDPYVLSSPSKFQEKARHHNI